jgi:hypothetical protein
VLNITPNAFRSHPIGRDERPLTTGEIKQAVEDCVRQSYDSENLYGFVYLYRLWLAAEGWNLPALREFERMALLKLDLPPSKS